MIESVLNAAAQHIAVTEFAEGGSYGFCQLRPSLQAGHRGVLAHKAEQKCAFRQGFGNQTEHIFCVFGVLRENQMTNQHTLLHHTLLVQPVRSGLTIHFPNGSQSHLRIIRRGGIGSRQLRVGIFEVRQINLHLALQLPQTFHAVIAGAVPHHGNPQIHPLQNVCNHGNVVTGRDQIDVVNPLVPQPEKNIPQLVSGDGFSCFSSADFMVLAEYAPQITPGKENGSGASGAGNAGLLTEMGGGAGNQRQLRRLTKSQSVGPVDPAVSGTLSAKFHENSSCIQMLVPV